MEAAMKATRLTGSEARKLVFIASYPKNPHSKNLLSVLSGPAREIGFVLLNGANQTTNKQIKMVADEFKKRCRKTGQSQREKIKRRRKREQKNPLLRTIRQLKQRVADLEAVLNWR